ncbi:MAG: tetratricopeptide repeat protein [Myxococcales bacterium]
MKVVDLHPEELIDKLTLGERELSASERERLDAHLAQCSACRFEISVRADLVQEAPGLEVRPQLTFPSATERTRPAAAPRVSASIRPRSRRRWPLVMLAAALVLCAGGATAAVVTGAVHAPRWLPWVPGANQVVAPAPTVPRVAPKQKRVAQKPAPSPEVEAPVAAPVAASMEAVAAPLPTVSAEPPPVAVSAPSTASVAIRVPQAALAASSHAAQAPSVAVFPSAPSASDAPSPRADEATPRGDAAAALFADANRARRDGNADRAVSLYRALQSRYPGSSESELSRALLAQLLLDRGSPEAALAGFDRYLAQGTPVLGAEALVGRARALEQLGKPAQAAAAWREVQSRFAGSVHARLAATRLAALGMR